MKRYLKISIASDSLLEADRQIAELSDIGFYAFEQDEKKLTAYIEEDDFREEVFGKVISDHRLINRELVEEENWNEKWEKDFTPVVVKKFAAIRANFHPPFTDVEHDLVITPKMSFGTGHHPTTFLMVEAMEKISFRGKEVFDFGTGTGVLAILAEKLGAERVIAVDYDEWSIVNTRENITANHCRRIEVLQADSPAHAGKVDIILANINLHILKKYAADLTNLLNAGGVLLVSGFLSSDVQEMEESFAKFLMNKKHTYTRNEWSCMVFGK